LTIWQPDKYCRTRPIWLFKWSTSLDCFRKEKSHKKYFIHAKMV
jgi:hypothetical protein